MTKNSTQIINREEFKKLMRQKGWSEPMTAKELEIDYSYLYRFLRGQRNAGKKLIIGLLNICKKDGLDVFKFFNLDNPTNGHLPH